MFSILHTKNVLNAPQSQKLLTTIVSLVASHFYVNVSRSDRPQKIIACFDIAEPRKMFGNHDSFNATPFILTNMNKTFRILDSVCGYRVPLFYLLIFMLISFFRKPVTEITIDILKIY